MKKEKPELNAARAIMLGHYRAIYNIECVDKTQKIWRGEPVPSIDKRTPDDRYIYFSRAHDKSKNDLDAIFPELHFDDTSILGVKFLLVAAEKLLFGYEPPPKAGILVPKIGVIPMPRGRSN